MKTLTSQDLDLVTGGSYPLGSIDKPLTGSSSNDGLLSAVQGIQSSLKDLGNNQNQGLFGGSNGLLFAALLMSQRNNNNTVVYQGGGPVVYGGCGGHRGHGFRVRYW